MTRTPRPNSAKSSSSPGVLPDRRANLVWSPIAAAAITAVPGLIGLAVGRLLLFPSLGPTALMQAHVPEHPSSRPYNVLVSHIGGLASAYLAVTVFGIANTPSVFVRHALSPARVGASVLAILLGTFIEIALDASHPPAASTTLLAALGSFKRTWGDAALVVDGVVLVLAAGEIVRRIRLATTSRGSQD